MESTRELRLGRPAGSYKPRSENVRVQWLLFPGNGKIENALHNWPSRGRIIAASYDI